MTQEATFVVTLRQASVGKHKKCPDSPRTYIAPSTSPQRLNTAPQQGIPWMQCAPPENQGLLISYFSLVTEIWMRESLANVYNVSRLSVTSHSLGIDLPKARHHAIITSVRVTIRCICIDISISASWDSSGRSTCSAAHPHIFRASEKVLDLSCDLGER